MASGEIIRLNQGIVYEGYEGKKVKPIYSYTNAVVFNNYGGKMRLDADNNAIWIWNDSVLYKYDFATRNQIMALTMTYNIKAVKIDIDKNIIVGLNGTIKKYNGITGALMWSFTQGGDYEDIFHIDIDKQNNIYYSLDTKVRKLIPNGASIWAKNFGIGVNISNIAYCAYSNCIYGAASASILKINATTGELIKSHSVTWYDSNNKRAEKITVDNLGNVFVGTTGNSNGLVFKYDANLTTYSKSISFSNGVGVKEIFFEYGRINVLGDSFINILFPESLTIDMDLVNNIGLIGFARDLNHFYYTTTGTQ